MPSIQGNQTLHLQILVWEQVRVNPDIPVKAVQDQLQRELEVQISMSKAFRAKAKAEREIKGDHVLQYSMLRDYVVELQSTNLNITVKIAVERNTDPSLPTRVFQRIYICQVLVAVGLDSNNGIYPLAYALVEAKSKSLRCWFLQCLGDDIDLHPNLNFTFISDRQKGWCGQAYKDLLWRDASATNVRDFEKCRSKSDLLLNNICEVFNGKIVGGRDKPAITLLEYIREYCMKRIMNVQGVIDKCTGPLTPTATKIIEYIKKKAHLMKVQWNEANKYQVSGSLGDQCVVDVYMEGNILSQDTTNLWDQVLGEIHMSNNTFATQASCLGKEEPLHVNHAEILDTIKQHAKDKVERQQQVVISASSYKQAQKTEPAVGQDGSGGSGVGAIIGLSAAAGEGGACVASQVSETRNADGREMGDGVPTQSSAAGGASEWSFL
ncbi:hypothetical protein Tco_0398519 [Tanacetum coccineum]